MLGGGEEMGNRGIWGWVGWDTGEVKLTVNVGGGINVGTPYV